MKESNIVRPKNWRIKTSLKTVDIEVLEWFDRINGNSYFAATVTCNYGLKNEFEFNIGFQYGYGGSGHDTAIKAINELGLADCKNSLDLRDQKVIVRSRKTENCKKRDLMAINQTDFIY